MSRRCQVTGQSPSFGKAVSHSHVRTNRRWNPNIQSKRYWLASQSRYVTLKVSAKTIKTIDRNGIDAAVRAARARGVRV